MPLRAVITGDEDLLHQIIKAAIEGNVNLLDHLMKEDRLILDKVVLGSLSRNPLHTAAWYGNAEFVNKLLQLNPMLAWVLDSTDRTALHLASARGDVDVVKVLIKAAPEMCLAGDRHCRNLVHVAALKGNVCVLKVLIEASPHAARARLDRNETIVHLCVKLNQFESLKVLLEMMHDEEFVNAKDCEGNTILHLAVIGEHVEILKHVIQNHVIDKKGIRVNTRNASEHTAKDMLPKQSRNLNEMKYYLDAANARKGKKTVPREWISRNRDALMVVLSLIAVIAFQAGVNPPGGVWQDNSDGHSAGESVVAYSYPYWYQWYICCNTLGFLASVTALLFLDSGFSMRHVTYRRVLMVVMTLTIVFVVATYGISVFWITPKEHWHTVYGVTWHVILVFLVAVLFLLLRIYTIVPTIGRSIRRCYRKATVPIDRKSHGVQVPPSELPCCDSHVGRQTNV